MTLYSQPKLGPMKLVLVLFIIIPLVIFLCLVIVVGYPLVVLVGLKHVNLGIVPYFYVLHLALSQLLIFPVISLAIVEFQSTRIDCVGLSAFITFYNSTTELIVLIITLDRYMLHYHWKLWANNFRGIARARILMAVSWMLGVTGALFEFILLRNLPGEVIGLARDVRTYCRLKLSWDDNTAFHYTLLHLRTLSLVLFTLSVLKCCVRPPPVRNGSVAIPGNSRTNGTGVVDEPQVVNKFVISVVGPYILLPMPVLMTELVAATFGLYELNDMSGSRAYFLLILGIVGALKVVTTPLMCYFMTGEYRLGFAKLCTCKKKPRAIPKITYRRQSVKLVQDEESGIDRGESQFSRSSQEPLCALEL